jgi:uncharacterized protein (DUF58 family)
VAALAGLELVSATRHRRTGDGVHAALRHGREEEFFQHRPYVRGDDLRAVDWRASARTGHLLLKERHQPSRRPLTLLVDTSASMAFPAGATKLRQAQVLAAALAFLALRRGDSVEVSRLEGPDFVRVARLRPAPRALHAIQGTLSPLVPTGDGNVVTALARVGASVARNGLVVVLSDLYGDEARLRHAVASLRRVAEVAVVHVLAAAEREIPSGLVALEELEGGGIVSLDAAAIASHAARVAGWRERVGTAVRGAGAEWVEADAAEPALDVLARWLRRVS